MINVAVIGFGSMGRNHARVYNELSDVNLVAISDPAEAARREAASKFGCRIYADHKKMLKEEAIEAVSIAVPTKLHKQVALHCIDAGVHVLVEKPIADTEENAGAMIHAAEVKDVVLTVGHIERFNPSVAKLKGLIDSGRLGEITSIMARRVGVFPPRIKDANVFLDLAVHDIDIFNYFLGHGPEEVFAKGGEAFKSGREDHAIIALTYGENTTCMVQVNWITPVKIRELAVTGTKGYAELNYITQELRVFESNYEHAYDSFGDFVVKFGKPKEIEIDVEPAEPLKEELKSFIECITNKKRPPITGEDALLALKVAHKAIESFKKDRVVEI